MFVAPTIIKGKIAYTLFIEKSVEKEYKEKFEFALYDNFHYLNCRKLGQLESARIFIIKESAHKKFLSHLSKKQKMGDIKNSFLRSEDNWNEVFNGEFI